MPLNARRKHAMKLRRQGSAGKRLVNDHGLEEGKLEMLPVEFPEHRTEASFFRKNNPFWNDGKTSRKRFIAGCLFERLALRIIQAVIRQVVLSRVHVCVMFSVIPAKPVGPSPRKSSEGRKRQAGKRLIIKGDGDTAAGSCFSLFITDEDGGVS
ncbi:MAG: hypothetical protein KH072_12545 [Akkermansia sp.]|uniref:hypothetical protein n=1 Tax=Akkermansia sp. TaxID=1872421 RepID=UPI00257AE757|nr:hypothetical protein [Akkermansia sp.]MBS7153903.1 hypothetical protein [Akkermansia sp.]